jgi:hypothetical protein
VQWTSHLHLDGENAFPAWLSFCERVNQGIPCPGGVELYATKSLANNSRRKLRELGFVPVATARILGQSAVDLLRRSTPRAA